MHWEKWGPIAEIPEGGWLAFAWPVLIQSSSHQQQELIIVKQGGVVSCFVDRCSHQDIKLSEFGALQGGTIICFAHNARFSCVDGHVLCPPAEQGLSRWPIKVIGQDIFLASALHKDSL